MTLFDNLNCHEKEAIEELKVRMKDCLSPHTSEDTTLFYRFLKARNFDVDKAEAMLQKHLAWRKSFQIDTILETFKPTEFAVKFLLGSLIGFDKEGCLVRYSPMGNIDIRDVRKCIKMSDNLKHCTWSAERDTLLVKQENAKHSRNAQQIVLIFDLDNLSLANVTNKASTELFLRLTQLMQDHYPERLKAVYIINAPAYFTIVYSVVKTIMSGAVIKKIHAYGQNGWKEELLKQIDAEVLPAFLGGNRTDPDGNPDCNTFIFHGGKADPKYYLTREQRFFKDLSSVQIATVPQMSKKEIDLYVKECNSHIDWEFQTTSKDIGFGLFYKDAENELIEVLPIQKFDTHEGTETGSYRCSQSGNYVVIFDNTYSWMSSKEVHYCITVTQPEV